MLTSARFEPWAGNSTGAPVGQGVGRVDERRAVDVVVGPDQRGRVGGLGGGLGEHERDRLAGEAHPTGRERRAGEVRVHHHEPVVRGDAQRVEREHRHHARGSRGVLDVHRAEHGVGDVGVGESGVQRPGHLKVVHVSVLATQQPRVLGPQDTGAEDRPAPTVHQLAHGAPPCHGRRPNATSEPRPSSVGTWLVVWLASLASAPC